MKKLSLLLVLSLLTLSCGSSTNARDEAINKLTEVALWDSNLRASGTNIEKLQGCIVDYLHEKFDDSYETINDYFVIERGNIFDKAQEFEGVTAGAHYGRELGLAEVICITNQGAEPYVRLISANIPFEYGFRTAEVLEADNPFREVNVRFYEYWLKSFITEEDMPVDFRLFSECVVDDIANNTFVTYETFIFEAFGEESLIYSEFNATQEMCLGSQPL